MSLAAAAPPPIRFQYQRQVPVIRHAMHGHLRATALTHLLTGYFLCVGGMSSKIQHICYLLRHLPVKAHTPTWHFLVLVPRCWHRACAVLLSAAVSSLQSHHFYVPPSLFMKMCVARITRCAWEGIISHTIESRSLRASRKVQDGGINGTLSKQDLLYFVKERRWQFCCAEFCG